MHILLIAVITQSVLLYIFVKYINIKIKELNMTTEEKDSITVGSVLVVADHLNSNNVFKVQILEETENTFFIHNLDSGNKYRTVKTDFLQKKKVVDIVDVDEIQNHQMDTFIDAFIDRLEARGFFNKDNNKKRSLVKYK